MKKLFICTLILVLILTLAACGGESTPSATSQTDASSTQTGRLPSSTNTGSSASAGLSPTGSAVQGSGSATGSSQATSGLASSTANPSGSAISSGTAGTASSGVISSPSGTSSRPTSSPTKTPTKTPTKAPTKTPTSSNAGPTVPVQPSAPVNWEPVIDKDGTYHFGIGRTEYTGKLLTDFTSGTIKTGPTFMDKGEYQFVNGTLKAYTDGNFVDMYDNFTGGGLSSGNYSTARYVGVRVKNNNYLDVAWFHLQGDNIFLGQSGADVILAYDDGRAYASPVQWQLTRWCIKIPAGFEGTVLIPVSRLYSGTDMNNSTAWTVDRTPWPHLGFHVNCAGTESIDFRYVFLTSAALPSVEDLPDDANNITNPEYSYTEEQRITPFWKSNIMYNEILTMEESGSDISGNLLFVPTRIIAVVDATLQNEYVEGKDYRWVKGTNKIEWLNGSSIPYYYEGALQGKNEDGSYIPDYPNWDSLSRCRLAGVLYCADRFLWEKQICVTYEYSLSQVQSRGIVYTQYQGSRLPNTVKKLNNDQNLNVLFYGDSIFAGGDSSSSRNRAPYMPNMDALIANYLQSISSGEISFKNISIGGWTVENGLAALQPGGYDGKDYSSVSGYDLLILSFGMNNASTSASSFAGTTQKIVEAVKKKNPNIEVILVSCMCPNPQAYGFYGNQQYFGAALKQLADEKGYAFVDMFAVHDKILDYKDYSATTGNGINHPNDWLIRVYAQNILSTMVQF